MVVGKRSSFLHRTALAGVRIQLSIRSPRPTGAIFQAPLSRFSKPDNFALDTAAEEIARHIREFMR